MNNNGQSAAATQVRVACTDLDAALDFYTGEAGFRLDMILPADAPRIAQLSGHGITLRLERQVVQEPGISSQPAEDAWVVGRAGMQYRDLLPGREGGRLVASHIRIPEGGPVPDYVHYHRVEFQMIYCRRGWVRVVYQDQGPPFVMNEGDCVLQPPSIRHRVLEASPGLEVIEVSSPAEYETWREHALELPTSEVHAERRFDGQRFVRHIAGEATWESVDMSGVMIRDTGIAEATNGLGTARVLYVGGSGISFPASRRDDIRFLFVLAGQARLRGATGTTHALAPDDACLVPAGEAHVLEAEAPCEVLEVCLPTRRQAAT
jgi:mannose-6-phosphate isomerase-like protein (cupin superfamily)